MTEGLRPYLIDYWRFEPGEGNDDCIEISSPVWGRLRKLIEEKVYTADDGKKYRVTVTFIDASYANDTVTTFCADYDRGVYPILGRPRIAKNLRIKEFAEFKTQSGTIGFTIVVDHYKDRMAPVLRREWIEEAGEQDVYHFNAPVDTTDKQLKELTTETRREQEDAKGAVSYYWHRPGNVANELWDLLGYSYAAAEVLAWNICIQVHKMEETDWAVFWELAAEPGLFWE
jgi:hypothetical protein